MEHRLELLVEGARVGEYELGRRLGLGGFGQVWLAHRAERGPAGVPLPNRPQRRVALKILAGVGGPIDLVSEWFQGRQVEHPNVVRILDMGRDGELWFMAMEYIEGLNFRQLGREVQRLGGQVPLDAVIELGMQAARGLGAVHEARDLEGRPLQMIHRDVKPDNVMLDRHGIVRLVDFGIAKGADALVQTQINMAKGSPLWMAPEQHWADQITPAADLFSLATVLYELRVGRTLFSASSVEQLAHEKRGNHARTRLQEDAGLLGVLGPVLQECLQAKPERRPQTATELEGELSLLLESFPRGPSLRELYDMVTDERVPRTESLSEEWATLAISLMGPRFPDMDEFDGTHAEPPRRAEPELAGRVEPARPVESEPARRAEPEPPRRAEPEPPRPAARPAPAPAPPLRPAPVPAPLPRPAARPVARPIEERDPTTDDASPAHTQIARVAPTPGPERPPSRAHTPSGSPRGVPAVPPVEPQLPRGTPRTDRGRWVLGASVVVGLALALAVLRGGSDAADDDELITPIAQVEAAPPEAAPAETTPPPEAPVVEEPTVAEASPVEELCNGVDDDGDRLVWALEIDKDGDGFARCTWGATMPPEAATAELSGAPARGGDCDDSNARKYPGAREVAGEQDMNCDGQVVGLVDADGDGQAVGQDCNDHDAEIHRGATEIVANHIDENCDGLEDCYVDDDDDGFGVSGQTRTDATLRCASPGLATESGDCDDQRDTVYLNATERCGDGLDNNCNGLVDLKDPSCRPPSTASLLRSKVVGGSVETSWTIPGAQACDRVYLEYTVRGRVLSGSSSRLGLDAGREGSSVVYRGTLPSPDVSPQSLDWTLLCDQGGQQSHIAKGVGTSLL